MVKGEVHRKSPLLYREQVKKRTLQEGIEEKIIPKGRI